MVSNFYRAIIDETGHEKITFTNKPDKNFVKLLCFSRQIPSEKAYMIEKTKVSKSVFEKLCCIGKYMPDINSDKNLENFSNKDIIPINPNIFIDSFPSELKNFEFVRYKDLVVNFTEMISHDDPDFVKRYKEKVDRFYVPPGLKDIECESRYVVIGKLSKNLLSLVKFDKFVNYNEDPSSYPFYVYIFLDPTEKAAFKGQYLFNSSYLTDHPYDFEYKPMYVGKGKGTRCFAHLASASPKFFKRIKELKAQNIEPIILRIAHFTSDQCAYMLESEMIAHFKRKMDGGILHNLAPGGDCGFTVVYIIDSNRQIGEKNPNSGKHESEETKLKKKKTINRKKLEKYIHQNPNPRIAEDIIYPLYNIQTKKV